MGWVMTHAEFAKHLDIATAIVAKWPKWKQNILGEYGKQFRATPRMPVRNNTMTDQQQTKVELIGKDIG